MLLDKYKLIKLEAINKGWSGELKYYALSEKGEKLFLRLSPASNFQRKKEEFEQICLLVKQNIPTAKPLAIGLTADGSQVYQIFSWVSGQEAEKKLPTLSLPRQYCLGVKAGEALKVIHALPVKKELEDWSLRFNRKIDHKIKQYLESGLDLPGFDQTIAFVQANRHLIQNRPQVFQHGDYHTGNILLVSSNRLRIIDFDRFDYGDPYEEFNRIFFSGQISHCFTSGQIDGYFNGNPPEDFFRFMALYVAVNCLSSVIWARQFDPEEEAKMIKLTFNALAWFKNFKEIIPIWYHDSCGIAEC